MSARAGAFTLVQSDLTNVHARACYASSQASSNGSHRHTNAGWESTAAYEAALMLLLIVGAGWIPKSDCDTVGRTVLVYKFEADSLTLSLLLLHQAFRYLHKTHAGGGSQICAIICSSA